jgi:hypothetical protein
LAPREGMMKHIGVSLFLGALALVTVHAGDAAGPFRLTIGPDALVVSEATARGKVVFLGITREIAPDDVVEINRRLEVVADEDGDGQVKLDQPMVQRSMWVAVDLATGDLDSASPEGFRLNKVNWRGRGVTNRPDGRDSVEDARAFAEVLVVRPGTGAWILRLGDGSPEDADGAPDGRLEAALDRMTPLADSPAPPQRFQRDDVVVLMDPHKMEMTLAKVGGNQ